MTKQHSSQIDKLIHTLNLTWTHTVHL